MILWGKNHVLLPSFKKEEKKGEERGERRGEEKEKEKEGR